MPKNKSNKTTCVICYSNTTHVLCCSNEHKTCLTCIQNILQTCNCKAEHCCGINWRCPLCRHYLSLNPYQILAIGHGSWKIVNKVEDLNSDSEEIYTDSEEETDSICEEINNL